MCYSPFRKWKLSKSSLVETRSCVGTSPNLLTGEEKKKSLIWKKKKEKKKKGTRADLLIFNHLSGRLNRSSTPRVQTTPFKVNFGSFYKLSNKNNIPYSHTTARGMLAVAVWTQVLWFSVMLGYRTKVIFLFLFFSRSICLKFLSSGWPVISYLLLVQKLYWSSRCK